MNALATPAAVNGFRYRPGSDRGHYESYFQRANHPARPLAFWIRYTALVPRGRAADGVGELWAIWFDGERRRIVALKRRVPLADCEFSTDRLDVRLGDARLTGDRLEGAIDGAAGRLRWDLSYGGGEAPLLLLPERMYEGGFPKAKSLVGAPFARYRGGLEVDGDTIAIDDWVGSQNHNWGERHTDRYAWGQVAGFDDAPDVFLECGSARLRFGSFWTPWITVVVLRLDGREYRLNPLGTALRARVDMRGLDWRFDTAREGVRIRGRIWADPSEFAGLRYEDPTGRTKLCLNSKIARCELTVERPDAPPRTLRTGTRAAFELLTEGETWDVPIKA